MFLRKYQLSQELLYNYTRTSIIVTLIDVDPFPFAGNIHWAGLDTGNRWPNPVFRKGLTNGGTKRA